jgi:(R)-2-hydroxyacyl-CoA dehydratese activating ATPase
MKAVGLDIGSLTTKVVVMESDKVLSSVIMASGEEAESTARQAIEQALEKAGLSPDSELYIVSTGIGGKSISLGKQQKSITTCLARGISALLPSARMLIDMGAESSTIVKLNERGRLADWLGHDKCAAGTGMFLQQMAKLMQVPLEEMARLSLQAQGAAEITSTCAVFAESEVISHVHRDPPTPKEEIVAGIYSSLVSRIMALAKRVGIEKDVAVSGGVALNVGLIKTLENELGFSVLVPETPQIVAALGAAKIAGERVEKA